jgi:hypothetical protein
MFPSKAIHKDSSRNEAFSTLATKPNAEAFQRIKGQNCLSEASFLPAAENRCAREAEGQVAGWPFFCLLILWPNKEKWVLRKATI